MNFRAADRIFRRGPLMALLLGLLALAALISAAPTAAQSPPSAPILAVADVGDGTLTVSWISGSGATKHELAYSSDNGSSWTTYSSNITAAIVTISGADNAKTYVARVRAGNAHGWSGWTYSNSAGPYATAPVPVAVVPQLDEQSQKNLESAQEAAKITQPGLPHGQSVSGPAPAVSAPAAPQNLTVEPGDGYLDIAWDAVNGATGYDVRAKTSGSSTWHSVANNVSGTSYRYTTSETIDYVAVRARNAGGTSAWSELSRLPSTDWLNTVQSTNTGGASIASAQSQNQLAAPATITVTRDNANNATRLRGEELTVTWAAVTGADGYNLICSGRSGWSWRQCGSTDSGSTTTLKVTQDERGKLHWLVSYMVAVRAVTNNPAQASDWTRSEDAHPANQPVKEQPGQNPISVSRAAGSLTLSWIQPKYSPGYEIECATRENGVTGTHKLCADVETATLGSGRRVTATIAQWTVDGTTYTVDDNKTYDLIVRTTNAWGKSPFIYAPLIYPITLTASNIAATTATLTIAQYSGAWYYRRAGGPGATCDGPVSGTSRDLTDLTADTSYTYSAYSDSACSTLLATAAQFTTTGVSVSNLSGAEYGTTQIGNQNGVPHQGAQAFTTGSTTAGYTLSSIDIRFGAATGSPANLVVTLHAASGSDPDTSSTLATLGGESSPSAAGSYTYACSGSGCDLSAGTTYFVVMNAPGSPNNAHYNASLTTAAETTQPSNNGWSIADAGRLALGPNWSGIANSAAFRLTVTAKPNPTLTASNLAATTATLSIAHHHAAWYYKATSGPHTTCQGPVAAGTTSQSLSGLTAGTSYTYSAYSNNTCSTLLATAAQFTTPVSLTASNVASTTATLTIAGHTGQWWYQGGEVGGTLGTCTSVPSGQTANLTGLDSNTLYEYKAYDKANCAATDLLTSSRFSTLHSGGGPGFTATNVTHNSARLTLSNHTGNWWYRGGSRSGGEGPCTAGPSNFVVDLTNLTASTPYTYSAYSAGNCRSLITSATTVTFDTPAAP